jgi:hypothetical protein
LATFFAYTEEGPWEVSGVVDVVDRRLVVTHLEIQLLEHHRASGGEFPAAGITGAVLRDIRLEELAQQVKQRLIEQPKALDQLRQRGIVALPEADRLIRENARRAARTQLRKGRAGYPEDFYRGVALRYLEIAASQNRGVIPQLATEYGRRLKREIPRDTVKSWLRKARELGLLEFDGQGRSGARPGPQLYEGDGK